MDTHQIEPLLSKIGKALKALRVAKGYSSHESFASDHNLSRLQYWRLESGKANFTFKTLHKLLEIHQLTVEEFFKKISEDKHTTSKVELETCDQIPV